MSVICLHLKETDPYFNLAAEEYFLKNFSEDVFIMWQSESAIVVGKHQNALAEVNHKLTREKKIPVARRLSGGGTVFHDPGNLNYTFIKNVARLDQVNYSEFTLQIVDILRMLGLDAYPHLHNSIFIGDRKISGSADHVFKNRILHHGTLLFNSRLDLLRDALKVDLSRFEGKAVQSNRSEVTNIADHLQAPMSYDEFACFIFGQMVSSCTDPHVIELNAEDILEIERLKDEKYSRWEWIYGYSPRYIYRNELLPANGKISFSLSVEKGLIRDSHWEGAISVGLARLLSSSLNSLNHDYEALKPVLEGLQQRLGLESISVEELLLAVSC